MAHRLYLIRHGATNSTASNRVCGSSDIPLSARGILEMESVARYLADKELSAVFSSPLMRARVPAAALAEARQLKHTVINELTELDFGKWEGESLATLALRWPLEVARVSRMSISYTFPGGENIGAFRDRGVRGFEQVLAQADGPAVVYTHGGILRIIVGHLLKLSLPDTKALQFSTGSVTILEPDGQQHRVAAQNLFDHLPK